MTTGKTRPIKARLPPHNDSVPPSILPPIHHSITLPFIPSLRTCYVPTRIHQTRGTFRRTFEGHKLCVVGFVMGYPFIRSFQSIVGDDNHESLLRIPPLDCTAVEPFMGIVHYCRSNCTRRVGRAYAQYGAVLGELVDVDSVDAGQLADARYAFG